MPSLRMLLGKEVAAIPRPKTYTSKPDFAPVVVFEGQTPSLPVSICQLVTDAEITPGCSIMPDFVPLLLELAQPQLTRGTYSFHVNSMPLFASVCQELSISEIIPDCNVTSDLLLSQLELAQPQSNRIPYLFDLDLSFHEACLSLRVIEAERFPLAVQFFNIAVFLSSVLIFGDSFHSLVTTRVFGMNYHDRILRELRLPKNEEAIIQRKGGTRPLSKSYTEPESGQRRGRKSKPKPPSFWDLLYVILQPPIELESLENLYLPSELRAYQPAGIQFLLNNESALLADEMGTGKTVMTTVALRVLMQKGRANHALVVCPLSVLREWNHHLADWAPDLRVTFVRGNRDKRSFDWQMPAHVYVTTYDTLRSDIETNTLPPEKLFQFDVVVLDEAQNIKNPTSSRSRAIKRLQARQRWALTGTPLENKLEDIVSLFEFLRPGHLTSFDLYPARIKEKITPYFLRRRKEDVLPDLPSKQKQDITLELDQEQRFAYDQVAGEVRSELTALGPRVTKMEIFRSLQRLKQICNFAPGRFTSPKLDLLKEQVEEIIANERKVVVFSQYIDEGIDKLEQALKPYGIAKIVGGQSESVRNREVTRFRQLSEVSILLASVRAGGVGVNLQEANYVIHFDHWWNPAVMWQAEARVHRYGQKCGVNVYSYWMADTIEERIYATLKKKGLLFEDVVDGLSESQIDDLISTDEWLDMLGVKVQKPVQPELTWRVTGSLSLTEIRDRLYAMTPTAFEQLVQELMHHFGYPNVKVTGRTGDGGIDVISTRNTSDGIARVVAQCKRYRGTVGVEVARDLRGVLASDQSIQKGFLVTTGEISRDCLAFCEKSGVIIPIDGLQVANYIKQFGLAI